MGLYETAVSIWLLPWPQFLAIVGILIAIPMFLVLAIIGSRS